MKSESAQHQHPDNEFYHAADRFFREAIPYGLTFDDVSLATNHTAVLPRDARPGTRLSDRISLQIPIISADMDTVTESGMAISMALNGGLGIIHYNMTPERQAHEIARVKNHVNGLIQEPISVRPDQTIGDIIAMADERDFSFRTFPVTNEQGIALGLLRGRTVIPRYASRKAYEIMTPIAQVLTVREKALGENPISVADRLFNENPGMHKLLVLAEDGRLRGLFTLSDIERITEESRTQLKPARDSQFRLLCGAAVSTLRKPDGTLDKDRILANLHAFVREGVDVLAVSTAHGHSAGVGETVRLVRDEFKDMTIIAGNVTSGEGVEFLADAGADVVKIGQGPGSICTTRIVAGVGIPQLSALYVASRAAARRGVQILADGGITKSGDIVKALTLADAVMLGGLLAGCREAPGEILEIDGKIYKHYRGMGSHAAMKAGSASRYGHSRNDTTRKVAAEGVEALKEVSGSVNDTLASLVGGLQSGMGYLGAATLDELRQKARYIRVTTAGMRESAPHDIIEVKASGK